MAVNAEIAVKNLHPLEVRIILGFGPEDELSVERVERDLAFRAGNGNQALSWLSLKALIREVRRETAVFYELTDLGREWQTRGSPEERIIEAVRIEPLTLPEISRRLGLDAKDAGSAFGSLSKLGALAMDAEKRVFLSINNEDQKDGRPVRGAAWERLSVIRALLVKGADTINGDAAADASLLSEASHLSEPLPLKDADLSAGERAVMAGLAKKRGAGNAPFRLVERETVIYAFTEAYGPVKAALEAAGITGEEAGALTQEMLISGSWKGRTFRAFNVNVPPTRLAVGRTNPYAKFLEDVKDKLISLGFEEFDGPLVETEFWNSDALFMPQFHSARDIHDVYRVAEPERAQSLEEPWLSRVAAAHENGGDTGSRGWNYAFDRDFTHRLILRSQGTVMSAKTLPRAHIPGKYFGMLRCFRYDQVDATHLPDFYQTEGIVLGEQVNLRTLLGMLDMFAREVAGAKEVKYVPGYFPFTEPSVEVHIRHPVLGWFELGGSGIFRPEVTESLGVHVPVAAWGIGIDRMALMALGLNDLRELFSYDLEHVRLRRVR